MPNKSRLIAFPPFTDARGSLVVIEGKTHIPFEIKRIFYMYGTDPSAVRGEHANRRSEFVLICISGGTSIRLHNGMEEQVFVLDSPQIGLYIPQMVWKDMYDFSPDCVLLALSSEPYDAGEYIRDFHEFIKETRKDG